MNDRINSVFFCGKYNAVVGDKWQLTLPAGFACEFSKNPAMRILAMQEEGCVRIYPYKDDYDKCSPSEVANILIRRKGSIATGNACMRITIPEIFRGAVSFYYGATVTVVGMGDHLEIWPRPPWANFKRKVGRPSGHNIRLVA